MADIRVMYASNGCIYCKGLVECPPVELNKQVYHLPPTTTSAFLFEFASARNTYQRDYRIRA